MTKHDLGLPSGVQDSTYQQNREKEIEQLREKVKQAEQEVVRLEAIVKKMRGD